MASAITSAGGTAFIVGGDVAKVDDAKSIVKAVVDRCGKIDILVNCAGILEYARFGDIDPASFERQFSVNALSVVLMMQAAVPHFPVSGGRVVNVSTNIAYRPIKGAPSIPRRRRRSARSPKPFQKSWRLKKLR